MAPLPRYLGLDLGNRTGWALAEGNKLIGSGIRDFSVKAGAHVGRRGIKFYNFLLTMGHVDEIYLEKIAFTGNFKNKQGKWISPSNDGKQLYHGLLMLVEMYSAGFGIPIFEVHNSTLKKAFAGHGRAEKEEMCARAMALGWKGGVEGTALFHDEVDAIALLETQLREKYTITLAF